MVCEREGGRDEGKGEKERGENGEMGGRLGGGWREGRKGPIQECQGKV